MLHLQPSPDGLSERQAPERQPYAEAVSRLASIRHALRLVNQWGGGPAPDNHDEAVAATWDEAGPARQRCFERQSEMTVQAAAAGLEALLAGHAADKGLNQEASRALVDQIRHELEQVSKIVLR